MARESTSAWGAFIGFSAWYQVAFYHFPNSPLRALTEARVGVDPFILQPLFHVGMGFAAMLAFFFIGDHGPKGGRFLRGALYTLTFVVLLSLPFAASRALLYALACLAGLLVGLILHGTVFRCFLSLPPIGLNRMTVIVFAIVHGFVYLFAVLSNGPDPGWMYGISTGLFLAGAVFGLLGQNGGLPARRDLPGSRFSPRFMLPVIALILGMGICVSAAKALAFPEMPANAFSILYGILPSAAAMAFIYFFGGRVGQGTYLRWLLALTMAGFIAFQILGVKGRTAVQALTQSAVLFCGMVMITYLRNLFGCHHQQHIRPRSLLTILLFALAFSESFGHYAFRSFLSENMAWFGWIYALLAGLIMLIPRCAAVLEDFRHTSPNSTEDETTPLLADASEAAAFQAKARLEGALALLIPQEKLTPRELEVLAPLLDRQDAEAIAYRLGISLNTVRTHTKHICEKFGIKNRVELLNLTGSLGVLDRLSAREREVLQLASIGDNDEKIAQTLFISASTVRTHIHNMARKFGVESRRELILRYRGMVLSSSGTEMSELEKGSAADSPIPDSFAHWAQSPASKSKS